MLRMREWKSRNILPPKSRELLRINLSGKTISSVSAPKEAGGNCTSMKLLDEVGQVMVIVSDPAIWLYSPSVSYVPEKCDLDKEYGQCKIDLQSSSKTYTCMVPKCSAVIHIICDNTIRGRPDLTRLMCPVCRDIDPSTGKKRPKVPGCGRGRPRTNDNLFE